MVREVITLFCKYVALAIGSEQIGKPVVKLFKNWLNHWEFLVANEL